MAAQPQYTYQPQPNELPYYNALFTTADKSSSGHLSGAVAVEFLSLSKLPVDLLKQIWTMADQPPSNTLDTNKFYIAVRLIQLFQNGKKPIDLALNIADGEPPMRPPFFEGVNVQAIMQQQQGSGGASVAPRPQMQQQLSSQQLGSAPPQQVQQPTPQGSPQRSPQLNGMSAQQPPAMSQPATMNGAPPTMSPNNQQQQLAIQDPYTMTPQELSRYEQLFPTYAVQEADGMFVHGGAAVELFSKSGMPNEQLKAIWSMSDSPIDNKLDSIEFAIAMHLIVCVTKKGLSMPPSLPPSLAMLMNDARAPNQGGGGTVVGVGGQSVAAVPPSPGGIPSPDKMGGMMQQQQPQMNGGLAQPPPQQMGMAQQPPPAQMGIQQQQQQPPTIQQSNSFGVSPEGGTVDDAFAGLSNESVNVEEYSVAGDMSAAGGDASGFGGQQAAMSTMGGGVQQQQPVMPIQEVATPEPSPMPVKPTMQQTVMPPPPIQQQTQQQQTHALPPRSPRSTPRTTTAPVSSEESSAELVSLREAHQKLQAEVISLRAKAVSVSEEEQETQKEIAQLASEIGKLSMELSELKENVMDAKVKLGESVGILKVQLEKKGSLEAQVEEARITHEALTSANTAVEEANEMAMAQRAQSVAAAAMAKEEASVVVPEPAPQQPVETADLFSWGAPAPAAPEANSVAMQIPDQPASVASEISPVLNAAVPPPSDVDRDSFSVYSTSGGVNANPNPYRPPLGAAQQQPMGGGIPEPTNQGFDYTQQQQPQQAGISPMGPGMSPMGGASIPDPMGYQQPPVQPQLTPPRQQESFASYNSAPAPQQAVIPSGPPSPTKAELEEVKGKTVEAEQTFRKQADLVRSISTEVVQLESVAKQAEANMALLEGKTKKGSFVGGKKKKAKKEYEKAMEVAEAERKKVENAKAQLAAAEREAQNAKGNVDSLRSKYEEMEMQAATAASYMAAQQQTYGDNQSVVSAQPSMASAQPTVASVQQPAYNDPFGGMNMGQPPAQPTNDLYGAPMGGGGDYANPFL